MRRIGKHKIEFVNYTPNIKYWHLMENFCILPTIYTCITGDANRMRCVYFHWLSIFAGVEWERKI